MSTASYSEGPAVFISYMQQDAAIAEQIHDVLLSAGARPWLDKRELTLGDEWETEIRQALRHSDACVVCLRKGFDEAGFRQKEVRWALDELQVRPPGRGFIIPFLVEPCELPIWCQAIHAGADLSQGTAFRDILRAIDKHCGSHLSSASLPCAQNLVFTAGQVAGARKLLSDNLKVARDDRVLLVFDEVSVSAATCIANEVTLHAGAACRSRQVTMAERIDCSEGMVEQLAGEIREASAILLLGSGSAAAFPFRHRVLMLAMENSEARTGWLLGLTLDGLTRFASDWKPAVELTESIASLMGAAVSGRITTELEQETYVLDFELGDHRPVAATGEVGKGTWANLPAGEAYILPNSRTAQGMIAINGSLPSYVIPKHSGVVLRIDRGEVAEFRALSSEVEAQFRRLFYESSGELRTADCMALAEIGVGTNHTIDCLSGAALLDEKMVGMVHIGLGDSTVLGGSIMSSQHIDLVTRASRFDLIVGEVPLIVNGRICLG